MFERRDIDGVITILEQHGATHYHACQLVDFASYVELGGIPSRQLLERRGLPFTEFTSDGSDRSIGVWDKVFLNLQDFTDERFANGVRGVPNPYGPILLQVEPAAIRDARDVAICLRSASGPGFNRQTESLDRVDDVAKLFRGPMSSRLKDREELQQAFPEKAHVHSVEISCSADGGMLSLAHVRLVRVDPYVIGNTPLVRLVEPVAVKPYGTVEEELGTA